MRAPAAQSIHDAAPDCASHSCTAAAEANICRRRRNQRQGRQMMTSCNIITSSGLSRATEQKMTSSSKEIHLLPFHRTYCEFCLTSPRICLGICLQLRSHRTSFKCHPSGCAAREGRFLWPSYLTYSVLLSASGIGWHRPTLRLAAGVRHRRRDPLPSGPSARFAGVPSG